MQDGFAAANHVTTRRWFIAALAVALFYSALALRLAFRAPYLVQDDARQHVFWMWRFVDPTLFPNDLIADYFQAVAPAGYKLLYWIFARLGVDPLTASKILPAAIGLVIAWLAFRLFMELMPDPRGAFFGSVFLGQLIWLKDDVISATPRAFVCPLFLGFLVSLLRGRIFLCLVTVALQTLIYPQAAFVAIGILGLRLIRWRDGRFSFTSERRDYILFFAAIVLFAASLLPFASSTSQFNPTITATQARALPEFQAHGRSQFFVSGPSYWIDAPRSGLLPNGNPPHIIALALAAPACLMSARRKFRRRVLLQAALAATAMWAAAHLFLFKLHLPGRYSQWLFQIVFAIGAGATLGLICERMEVWRARLDQKNATLAARASRIALLVLGAAILIYPHLQKNFPSNSYVAAQPTELYEFLRTQPKTTLIATLRTAGSLIPVFAQRSVLVSAEHAIPYHKRYYETIRRRGDDLLRAHLSSDRHQLRAFIQQYNVDLILVGREPLTGAKVRKSRWFGEIAQGSQTGERPVLLDFNDTCKIWENKSLIVLDAHRIEQMIQP